MNQQKINPVIVFPENLNEIINKTIDEINLKNLTEWLKFKKIKVNISGKYILPNYEEIKRMVTDTIMLFYANDGVEYFDPSNNKFSYLFDALIDGETDTYYVVAICLKMRNGYFDFDFYLYSSDVEGQLCFETSFDIEAFDIIMFNYNSNKKNLY